jgi:cytoskeletal protein RodZ
VSLLIVVALFLVVGLIWRARTTRRLTMEESVDRYRRTLSAVHEAARRSVTDDGEADGSPRPGPTRLAPIRARSPRLASAASRQSLLLAAMAVVTVVAVAAVITTHHGKRSNRSAATTTTRPRVSRATTTTAKPAPTTTAPLLAADGASKTDFRVAKASYTLVVQTTTGACWVDVRSPTGTALFTGTLAVGASQSITAAAMTVRLGNPASARLSIDGTPVPIDLAAGSPATLHFVGTPA